MSLPLGRKQLTAAQSSSSSELSCLVFFVRLPPRFLGPSSLSLLRFICNSYLTEIELFNVREATSYRDCRNSLRNVSNLNLLRTIDLSFIKKTDLELNILITST